MSAVSVAGPSQTDNLSTALNVDVGERILSQLGSISQQIVSLDGKVRATEAALADRTATPPCPTSPSVSDKGASNVASHSAGTDPVIVPNTEFLRSNTDIQRQVDKRFIELQSTCTQVPNVAGKL